ncbi:MAG: hypothetical protein ACTS8A_00685 [Arsenophonus sp. ET-LJ4-MAG3]
MSSDNAIFPCEGSCLGDSSFALCLSNPVMQILITFLMPSFLDPESSTILQVYKTINH